MNIRSLTRGDGVVIGAALLLLIASFFDNFSYDDLPGDVDMPNLWESGPVLLSVVLAGLIAAALVVTARALPQPRKVAGLELGVFGVAFAVFAAWSALGNVIDPVGGLDNIASGSNSPSAGTGLILALVATLLMAAAAIATPLVPALQAGLIPAPKPAAPQPYGAQPPQGYGYPGAQAASFGGQPQQGHQQGQPFGQGAPAQQQQQPPAAAFSPFWFAVPVARPLYAEDGSPSPVAELAPGTWYLAVEHRGDALVAQTQDGRRGVLQDTSGIQRG
ncbi:DUF5336 domain-containing protein [Streptomyces sp. NPDC090023]|uniref:DUF5336 domain-containing protein n=1 Tax=unclassified Streptomyces TaxID=2593676 RepID=UPI0038099951